MHGEVALITAGKYANLPSIMILAIRNFLTFFVVYISNRLPYIVRQVAVKILKDNRQVERLKINVIG